MVFFVRTFGVDGAQKIKERKIVHGHGSSYINLEIFVCSFMFAGLYNHSPLLSIFRQPENLN